MNRITKMASIAVVGCGLVIAGIRPATRAYHRWMNAEFQTWATRHATPLVLTDSVQGRASLRPLTDRLARAKVIGLGESTHGSHEFGILRTWIIQNLADSGLTDVIFEAPLPAALAVDAYIQGGAGDPVAALEGMGLWMHQNEAVLQLVQWLRSWNMQARGTRRIHFRGMDQGRPADALQCVRRYTAAVNREVPFPDSSTAPFFYARQQPGIRRAYANADSTTLRRATGSLETIAATMDAWPPTPDGPAASTDFAIARRCLEAAVQMHARWSRADHIGVRDSAMATNVLWWLAQSGPEAKAVVWAQNGHVAASWLDAPYVLGHDLRAALGSNYTAVALLFHHGAVLTDRREPSDTFWERLRPPGPLQVPPAHGLQIEAVLHATGIPALALDWSSAPRSFGVNRFLQATISSWDIGVRVSTEANVSWLVWPYVFGSAFDAGVFLDSTTPSRPIVPEPRSP